MTLSKWDDYISSSFKIASNFCEADLASLDDSVYTRPVIVQGSTIVKISLIVTAQTLDIYMNLKALEDAAI